MESLAVTEKLSQRLSISEAKNVDLQENSSHLDDTIRQQQAELFALNEEISKLSHRTSEFCCEIEAVTAKCQGQSNQIDSLKAEKDSLQISLESVEDEKLSLLEDLDSYKSMLSQSLSKIEEYDISMSSKCCDLVLKFILQLIYHRFKIGAIGGIATNRYS